VRERTTRRRGVVYVLPETKGARQVFARRDRP